MKLAPLDHEAFGVLMMDTRHAIIGLDILFHGSVDICSVIPREIVRAVIKRNAAAVILVHNHPSGSTEPSEADRRITQDIKKALSLIECRVLDHLIVGENITSFAKRNMM
jgi:DNA repair protein RadC